MRFNVQSPGYWVEPGIRFWPCAMLVFPARKKGKGNGGKKTPPKGNAGDNLEQFGYKQELRRGMGLWDAW